MGATGSSYGGMGNTGVIHSLYPLFRCLGKLDAKPINREVLNIFELTPEHFLALEQHSADVEPNLLFSKLDADHQRSVIGSSGRLRSERPVANAGEF